MMRGTPGMRLALAVLSPAFLLLCVVAIRSEETRPWMDYQEQFKQLYISRATAKLRDAESRNDDSARARWQRVVDEVSHSQPEIAQVYLEDLKVVDRCVTCHAGIDNGLFEDAPQPFRTHSGDALKHHDHNVFGCTPCHEGQGVATSTDAAHGREDNWLRPMLPTAYVQSRCAACHEVTHGVEGAEVVTQGADLFMARGCYGCHDPKSISYVPKFGSPLNSLELKLANAQRWMYAWIKDPAAMKPDTAMPEFKLQEDEVGKITAFLLSLPEGEPYPPVDLGGASEEEGKRLFTERGCAGCHAVEADDHSASARVPHLAGVGSKVTPEWLDRWIADPKSYNPDTGMPKTELEDDERHAVVAYLMTLKRADPLPPAPDLSQYSAADGKDLVTRYECFGCHAIEGFEETRPAVPDLAEFAGKSADELDFGTTEDVPRTKWGWLERKLRDPLAYQTEQVKLRMPGGKLTDDEMRALVTYVLAFDTLTLPARYAMPASAPQQALSNLSSMIIHLNCRACHRLRLDDEEPRVARFFELKSMIPPTLDGVGGRLQGQYMYEFLLEPKAVRPWMDMRMPTFGFTEDEARALVEGFAATAAVTNPYTYVVKANVAPDNFQRGIRRFRHFKCVQCHPTSIDQGLPEGVDPEDLSINLTLTKTRLRPDWLKDFMARPKEIAGMATRMPTVFYTVDGTPKVDRPQDDINDITTYLMGMVEPPEVTLQAEEEAIKAEQEDVVDWSQVEY